MQTYTNSGYSLIRRLSADSVDRLSKEQLIGFFEKITGGVRQHDALPSNLFFVYLMREEEMFTAERREFFLKELVRWNILSLEAKGAFNEIIKLRNEHIHGRFEKIIARYCNDSRKLDQYFGDLINKRKDEMVELHPFKLEWNPHYALYPEWWESDRYRMKKIKG